MEPIDYAFYRDEYLGGVIPQEEFARYAQRAQQRLCADTANRAANVPAADVATAAALRLCTCALAEVLYTGRDAGSGAVSKETLGSWSRSYTGTASQELRIARTEAVYLGITGLLYKGRECHA